MNWVVTVLAVSASVVAASGSAASPALKITGFHQGLMEFDSNDEPRIYKSGNTFPYVVNGKCIAAKKEHSCMWHGFEFDFETSNDFPEIVCTSEATRKRDQTTPDAVIRPNVTLAKWGFVLKGHSGHYIRPQYTFNVHDEAFRDVSSCTLDGEEVLKFDFTITPQT